MSRHNPPNQFAQAGFTLVELLITIAVISIVSTVFYSVFSSSVINYFNLQKNATNFNDLAFQSQRIAKVLRGLTDISSATSSEIVIYGYFSPTDAYVSQVRYYKNATNTKIMADVTGLTANPPVGTLIPASLKTYTVFDNYYQVPSANLFTYLDSNGAVLAMPVTDLRSIKGIRVNLAVPQINAENSQSMNIEVSLRNRKTNL